LNSTTQVPTPVKVTLALLIEQPDEEELSVIATTSLDVACALAL
jgi:hypothetical protein